MTTKDIILIINETRLILCARVEEAKAKGKPDDELAEADDNLLDMQERIMNEGVHEPLQS